MKKNGSERPSQADTASAKRKLAAIEGMLDDLATEVRTVRRLLFPSATAESATPRSTKKRAAAPASAPEKRTTRAAPTPKSPVIKEGDAVTYKGYAAQVVEVAGDEATIRYGDDSEALAPLDKLRKTRSDL